MSLSRCLQRASWLGAKHILLISSDGADQRLDYCFLGTWSITGIPASLCSHRTHHPSLSFWLRSLWLPVDLRHTNPQIGRFGPTLPVPRLVARSRAFTKTFSAIS